MCRSTKFQPINEVVEDEIPHLGHDRSCWTAQIGVNGHNTTFKLDTGAAVTVLSDHVQWLEGVQLTETHQVLRGPGGIRLPVKGVFHANLMYRQNSITESEYVLHNQPHSLLGERGCVELGLIIHTDNIDAVDPGLPTFRAEFPKLFSGLDKLQAECHITVRPDAKPHCQEQEQSAKWMISSSMEEAMQNTTTGSEPFFTV